MRRADVDWDAAFAALEAWRAGSAGAPSVTSIAEQHGRDPWAVLASTIVSLRTKDAVTLAASSALLERAPSPAALLGLTEEEIACLIYPAGFYRAKAANLKRIAAILLERHNGAVPEEMEALLALPGAGRKTANLVLIEAFGREGICVDTHVHRICNRRGWVSTAHPDQTELVLREILPRKHWKPLNGLLVRYGQVVCRPAGPFCSRCVIPSGCERRGLRSSR